jgi:hypothetical protein
MDGLENSEILKILNITFPADFPKPPEISILYLEKSFPLNLGTIANERLLLITEYRSLFTQIYY